MLKVTNNQIGDSEVPKFNRNSPGKNNQFRHSTLNIKREANSTGTQSASKGSHYGILPPMNIKHEAGVLPKIRKKVSSIDLNRF